MSLALRLQQLGIDSTLFAERTPDQIRAGQLLNPSPGRAEGRGRP